MIATLLVILLVGWLARRVIGQRLLGWFEALVARVPLASTIYGSARKLLDILQTKPDGTQRVVLIDFTHTQMKSVGFVTRLVREQGTGRELPAVYVSTRSEARRVGNRGDSTCRSRVSANQSKKLISIQDNKSHQNK